MFRAVLAVALSICAFGQSQRSPQEILNQALAAQQAGRFHDAIAGYREILSKYPNIPEIRSNLGTALAGAGLYSDAIVEYKRALALKDDAQVRLNLGLAYYKTDQLALAIDDLKIVREKDPDNTQILTVLADSYLKLGRNKDVIALLTPAQQAHPDNRAFDYMLGTALVRDNQPEKGQVIIDKILRDGDSAEARLLMGTTKFMVKDFAGAMKDLQQAVALNPHLPDLYAYYGLALMSTGDPEGAKKAFEKELESNPNHFDANLRLGVLRRQDGDVDGALKYFQHALEIRPGDLGVRYQIAGVEVAKGELDKAQRDLEALVKEAPQFTEAHVSLATVYFRQKNKAGGDRERAIVLKLNAERQAAEPGAKETP